MGQLVGDFKCQWASHWAGLPVGAKGTPRGAEVEACVPRGEGRAGKGLTAAGVRVLRLSLSHLLWERGAGGVEAHLRVLRGL